MLVAMVVTAALIAATMRAPSFVAPFVAVAVPVEVIRPSWRLPQEIHRLIAGAIACAMFRPMPGMARRHVHVDWCARRIDRWGRRHHHGLPKQQCRPGPIADIDTAIDPRRDLPAHCGIHIGLRMRRAA